MQKRTDYLKANAAAVKLMFDLETGVRQLGLPARLLHLVRLRASQINGCAFCIAMHTKEARAEGEDQRRLDLLQSWHETDLFDEREAAALQWTEALTRIAETHAPDDAYARLAAVFDDKQQVALTLAINAINSWNRLAIGFRAAPQP